MEASPHPWPTLGVLLLRDGLVTKELLVEILDEQRNTRRQRISGHRLGEIVVERGLVAPNQIARLIAEQYELPYLELDIDDVDPQAARLLTMPQIRRFGALPISRRADGSYLVAVADPSTVVFSDELREILGLVPHFAVVGPDALESAVAHVQSQPRTEIAEPAPLVDEHLSDAPGQTAQPNNSSVFETGRAAAQLWPPLGALLIREGLLTDAELEAALAQQRLSTSQRLGEILVERGTVSSATIARLVAEQYELDFLELDERNVDASIVRLLPEAVARTCGAVPIARHQNGGLDVVIADPTKMLYSDDLHSALGVHLTLRVASQEAIDRLIDSVYGTDGESTTETEDVPELYEEPPSDAARAVEADVAHDVVPPYTLIAPLPDVDAVDIPSLPFDADVEDDAPSLQPLFAPADELPITAIRTALESGAEAVHLSHEESELRVRARVDGSLSTIGTYSAEGLQSLLAELGDDPTVDLHVIPTHSGSKVTVVANERPGAPLSFAELGFPRETQEVLRTALERPGIVIVTGLPGSGVTSTLYAALGELNTADRVVATLESRVSAVVAGVDQVELDATNDLTVSAALQALVDSDTDVVLVDAAIDAETVAAAIRYAHGGRSVLIGLQESDARTAIAQLSAFDVDLHALGGALTCVIAQHFVRTVCADCRETYYATPTEIAQLGLPADDARRLLARGRGCTECKGQGLRGRQLLLEVITVTDAIGELIRERAPASSIRAVASAEAAPTMRDEAIRLCLEGRTTPSEIARVPGATA